MKGAVRDERKGKVRGGCEKFERDKEEERRGSERREEEVRGEERK